MNLLSLRNINKDGMDMFEMEHDRNMWKKIIVERTKEYGRRQSKRYNSHLKIEVWERE